MELGSCVICWVLFFCCLFIFTEMKRRPISGVD